LYPIFNSVFCTCSELNSALLSLGIEPSARVTSRYQNAALGGRLDLACFIRVTMTRLEDPDSTLPAINDVFAEFDEDGSGKVPLAALLHLLCEVDTASALGIEDVNQLMQMTGILGELQRKDPAALYSTMLDYQALARHMAFPLPTGASAATGTRTPK
jgi:Ca2+-binding EF-hand superfamily protein